MAVLQGWSKNTFSQRLTGIAFLVAFGIAAGWSVKILFAAVHR
jgi:hypothetical protein